MKDNPLSKIVILNDYELFVLSRVFLKIPFEYGFTGVVGKKYKAIKDYLKWNGFDVSYWTPIIVQMGSIWATTLANTKE